MSESQFTGQPEANPTVAPVTTPQDCSSCTDCADGDCPAQQGPELSADTDTETTSEPSPE